MNYTDEHYALMEKLENGLSYDLQSEHTQELLQFLDTLKIAQPRADIDADHYELSEYGKCVLAEHRKDLSSNEKVANDEAKQERQQRFENKLAIANLLVPLVTFLLGFLIEYFSGIVDFFFCLLT